MFSPAETAACEKLIALALAEDLGDRGDVTSQVVIPEDLQGSAVFLAKAAGVVAGLPAAELVMKTVDARLHVEMLKKDGDLVTPRDRLATVAGPMRSMLAAERTALNFLQHMSGIATLTRSYVDEIAGCSAKILDTRKTLPGWRLLEKYAVRCGGGHNHRMGLHDGILIKDNHRAALGITENADSLDIVESVMNIEDGITRLGGPSREMPVEVEVDSLQQLEAALGSWAAIVLLDNMTLEEMREAVRIRNKRAPEVLLEASGGVNLQTVRAIAATGVDRISIGALTHSAPALDIALDYESLRS